MLSQLRILSRQFRTITPFFARSMPSYSFAQTPNGCLSALSLHNILNPALLGNLKDLQRIVQTASLGLQYYNFLLDSFAETRLLHRDEHLSFLELILKRLADPDTYQGQVYSNEEMSFFSFRIIKNFLRLLECENRKIITLVDGSYPIFTKFSKHLIELQGLIAFSQLQEIYQLIDKYLDQEFQSPYITFMLEEFQGEIGSILEKKNQKLLTQQQRKSVIRDYVHPDAVPYLAHTKVESYSRKQKILKIKLENGRQFVMFGNSDTRVDSNDFDVVRELLGEFNSVPILIAEDLPVQKISKKEKVPIVFNDKIVDKNVFETLQFKVEAYQNLGYQTHLKGEELYNYINQYLAPEKYDIDFTTGNVWIHKKDQFEFHTLATAYITYLNQLQNVNGKPELYLCKLPKSFQNNELTQRYSLNQMKEMLTLCKYTQLLESTRYMYKFEGDTIQLPCQTCNKQYKVKAPPLPKGYMDVISGENLYALTKRDNFFVQSLAKVLRGTKQNAVIITSNRNFYNAVAAAVSNGEFAPLRKDKNFEFDFANSDLEVGRKEYLKFMNKLIGKGSNNTAAVSEYFEKQTILDVLDNYDANITEELEGESGELFNKYAYNLSWDKVLEALPEKDREVLKARSRKEANESCFIHSSVFHSGKKRMITSQKVEHTDEKLKSQFVENLKKQCGVN